MKNDSIKINGREFTFTKDETILDVCKRNGIFIPTFCHLKGTTPTGSCRICVVEVEKARFLVPSCSMPASSGMIIQTESAKVVQYRRLILELLLSTGNHNCAIRGVEQGEWTSLQLDTKEYGATNDLCEAYGSCKLQEYAYRYQAKSEKFKVDKPKYTIELKNPLLIRDFSRCILCGRCVQACNDIQVNNAISIGYRGNESKIVTRGDESLSHSDCYFCGECLRVCPVGALIEKKNRFNTRKWAMQQVSTTCYYCGVGCQLTVHVNENKIVKVTGAENEKPNMGSLCVKGHFAYDFIHSKNRLQTPMIKKNGTLQKATWEEALDTIAKKISEIKMKDGVEAIAGIVSPKGTCEDLYLFQKLCRDVIGTENVTQSEHIVIPGTFMHNTFDEIENADVVIVVNADVTKNNPIASNFIKRGVLKGNTLLVIDSRNTMIAKHATRHLQPEAGTEDLAVCTLNKVITSLGDDTLLPEKTAEITGISRETMIEASELITLGERVILIYDHTNIQCVEQLEHFKQLAGNNINCFSGSNNTQGALLMGLIPGYKPGYKKYKDSDVCFQKIVHDLSEHTIKLLYCIGENVAMTAIGSKAFIISQSIFKNHGNEQADVLLPAATWSEYDGTYINTEQRINRVRKAIEPSEEVKPGWKIYQKIAQKLGFSWDYIDAQDIWDNDIITKIPALANATYSELNTCSIALELPHDPLPDLIVPGWKSAQYHTSGLMDECTGLEGILPHVDRQDIIHDFTLFLEQEKALNKKEDLESIIKKYATKKGAIIPVLQRFQETLGYVPPVVQRYIALELNVPPSDVYGIVSFYSFFTQIPRGKYVIKICMGTACYVMGANEITHKFVEKLGINVGDTTEDRMFTLATVRCLGACGLAPVIMVNDTTFGQVTPAKVDTIITTYLDKIHATD